MKVLFAAFLLAGTYPAFSSTEPFAEDTKIGKAAIAMSAPVTRAVIPVPTGTNPHAAIPAVPRNRLSHPADDIYSPDGRWFAAKEGNKVTISSAASNELVAVLGGHSDPIRWAMWSPDSGYIITASHTLAIDFLGGGVASLLVWNPVRSRKLYSLVSRTRIDWDAPKWSPDSQWIAIGSSDHTVIGVNVETGQELRLMHGEKNVHRLDWDPTSQFLMVSSDGNRPGWFSNEVRNFMRIWEVSTGKNIMTLPLGDRSYHHHSWSPDGTYLLWVNYTTNPNHVQLFHVQSDEKIAEFPLRKFENVNWAADSLSLNIKHKERGKNISRTFLLSADKRILEPMTEETLVGQ